MAFCVWLLSLNITFQSLSCIGTDIVVLICISLMISDIFPVLMNHLHILLVKYLLKSFAHFWIGLCILFLSCKSSLYILDTGPLLDIWFAHIFSCLVCVFIFLLVNFEAQKFYFIYLFIYLLLAKQCLCFLVFYFLNFKIFNSYMRYQTWTPLPPPSP